jgi:hypothetical protein
MPNTFIDNKDAWLRMSDIDYVGQFVKVWLAFNAWYRSAYAEREDRKIINEFKWQGNSVRNTLRPKLESSSDDAVQFRSDIGLLHQRLENFELLSGKGAQKKRITLRNVFLRENLPNKQVSASITRKNTGVVRFNLLAAPYDLVALPSAPNFIGLSPNLQSILRGLYSVTAPSWVCDLTTYNDAFATSLECGSYNFMCGSETLFAGVTEVIYEMRCTLFHGELAPTKEAVFCYEPAFRIVRRFLDCVI